MADETMLKEIKERKLERMRLGQSVCEIVPLLSDPETRVGLVPLTEAEYDQCIRSSAFLDVPENVAGAGIRDRHENREVIVRALRNPTQLDVRMFDTVDQMMEYLEPPDVNHLYDAYVEMTTSYSPHIAELSEEDVDFLKDYFASLQWNALSGRQLYALSRFISVHSPSQLSDRLLGSTLITS